MTCAVLTCVLQRSNTPASPSRGHHGISHRARPQRAWLGWIRAAPVAVVDDDGVGGGEVDAQPAGAGGQQEHKPLRVLVERLHVRLPTDTVMVTCNPESLQSKRRRKHLCKTAKHSKEAQQSRLLVMHLCWKRSCLPGTQSSAAMDGGSDETHAQSAMLHGVRQQWTVCAPCAPPTGCCRQCGRGRSRAPPGSSAGGPASSSSG